MDDVGVVAFRRIDDCVWHARCVGIECSFDNGIEDGIISGSDEDCFEILIPSSTDETSEWRTDEISYSSSSISDIIDDRRHVMIDRLSCGSIEQTKRIYLMMNKKIFSV